MTPESSTQQRTVRARAILVWAIAFGLVFDALVARPRRGRRAPRGRGRGGRACPHRPPLSRGQLVFLAAAMVSVSFVVVRASPCSSDLDVAPAIGLFALAAASPARATP